MKVIVGLGNPGPDYERTRHNVGWWVVDHLADVWRFEGWKKDGQSRVASGSVSGQRVRLVKPQTYMNLSGSVLRPYLRRENWNANSDLLIVVDEVALPIGSFRVRSRGSAGGHNGLKSIEGAVGSQDYARLRIGVGPEDPGRRGELSDYVLGDFGKREEKTIRELLPTVTQLVEFWLQQGAEAAMNRFNRIGKAATSTEDSA
jgi:PTH1 family peptidyl-tRNA hydrolase